MEHSEPAPFFSLEGNIGAGKSSACATLETHIVATGGIVHVEKERGFDVFLDEFSADPTAIAPMFQTAMHFISTEQQRECQDKHRGAGKKVVVIRDRGYPGTCVFSLVQLWNGTFKPSQFAIMKKLMARAWADVISPSDMSMYVYCSASPETCLSRIRKRGREGEKTITLEYLRLVHRAHAAQIAAFAALGRWTVPCVVDFEGAEFPPDKLLAVVRGHQHALKKLTVSVPSSVAGMAESEIETAVLHASDDFVADLLSRFMPESYEKCAYRITLPEFAKADS